MQVGLVTNGWISLTCIILGAAALVGEIYRLKTLTVIELAWEVGS